MLGACVKKELLHHVASFRFWVGTLLTIVLAAASTWIAARDYELRLERYRDRLAAHEAELRSVSVYSFLQPLAVRPPEPLSVLDRGVDARLGTDVRIHLFAVPAEATSGSRGNELLVALPAAEVDLTTIVVVVLGLLALLLACDAIGEREEGTLRTVLAQSVRRRTLLAGKVLGGLLTLALPLAAALLVSSAILLVTLGPGSYEGRGLRILGLVGSYLIYLGLMFLLGLLVSLGARSSSRALSAAVLLWLVTVVVLPVVAWSVAGSVVDVQEAARRAEQRSLQLVEAERRQLDAAFARQPLLRTFSGHTASFYANGSNRAVRYRNGSAAFYGALREYYRFEVQSGMRQAERLYAVRRAYEERLRQSERLGVGLAAVSPAFLLDRLSESFSGTSLEDYDDFLADCRRHRLALIAFLQRRGVLRSWRWFTDDSPERLHPWPRFLGLQPEDVAAADVRDLFNRLSAEEVRQRVQLQRNAIEADSARRLDPSNLPWFPYHSPGFLECIRRALPEGIALLLLLALTAAAVCVRFARYEVR
jgi:ABC-type transport system involved in multi-copper enzyme maturation permease subunit